jgi:hypothetical protein
MVAKNVVIVARARYCLNNISTLSTLGFGTVLVKPRGFSTVDRFSSAGAGSEAALATEDIALPHPVQNFAVSVFGVPQEEQKAI